MFVSPFFGRSNLKFTPRRSITTFCGQPSGPTIVPSGRSGHLLSHRFTPLRNCLEQSGAAGGGGAAGAGAAGSSPIASHQAEAQVPVAVAVALRDGLVVPVVAVGAFNAEVHAVGDRLGDTHARLCGRRPAVIQRVGVVAAHHAAHQVRTQEFQSPKKYGPIRHSCCSTNRCPDRRRRCRPLRLVRSHEQFDRYVRADELAHRPDHRRTDGYASCDSVSL